MTNNKKFIDLSEDSLISKVPQWLRWILFLPASIIGCVIVAGLVKFLQTSTDYSSFTRIWGDILQSALIGFSFVVIAGYIAPKKQLQISILLASIVGFLTTVIWTISLLSIQSDGDKLYMTFHLALLAGGAIGGVFYIKSLIDEYPLDQTVDTLKEKESSKAGVNVGFSYKERISIVKQGYYQENLKDINNQSLQSLSLEELKHYYKVGKKLQKSPYKRALLAVVIILAGILVFWWFRFASSINNNASSTSSSCQNPTIKGNITSTGEKIYHMVGDEYYNQTEIDDYKGERWFCTESEASSAGWRHAKI